MRDWPSTVLGRLPIVRAGMDDSAEGFIRTALAARGKNERPFYSTSANGQVIALYGQDGAFRALMDQADQIHADGMPMVRYSKMFSKNPVTERVATTDLVHAVAERAVEAGVRFYFLGASEEVNARAVERMKELHPGLVFAGRRNGYFKREEEDAIVADILASKTDILWIGLGVPLEQAFVSRNIDRLRVGVIKTSGGLFDFLSGRNKRAPGWMQAVGLEWAYRMYLEPRRLGWRYLASNPVALHALFRHSAG
ncbi:MAG TPA: WecB/TagA/CpsF family glycosyltransferase [Rhizobiaceae bacterium]|nr:WecB/TagA/CpsF family glycosyltransferase [Rhizobiaceae bacterium]